MFTSLINHKSWESREKSLDVESLGFVCLKKDVTLLHIYQQHDTRVKDRGNIAVGIIYSHFLRDLSQRRFPKICSNDLQYVEFV